MSRFFAASDSSSEESSEEELYSNDEASEQEDSDKDSDEDDSDDDDSSSGSEAGGANRFLKDADSDSESEDEDTNKVLKSAKDKRFDELEATIRQIENAQKINDWAVISDRTCTLRDTSVGRRWVWRGTWRMEMLTCAIHRVRQAEPPGAYPDQAERWQGAQAVCAGHRRPRDHCARDTREAEGYP
jgi:hypothetical protein